MKSISGRGNFYQFLAMSLACLGLLFSFPASVRAWSLELDPNIPLGSVRIHFDESNPTDTNEIVVVVNPKQQDIAHAGSNIVIGNAHIHLIAWVELMASQFTRSPGVISGLISLPHPILPHPVAPMPVAGAHMPVAGGPMPMAGGLMPVAGGPMPVAGGLMPVAGGLMPVAGGPMPVAGGLMPVAGGPMPVAGDPMPVAGGPMPVAGGLMPVAGGAGPVAISQQQLAHAYTQNALFQQQAYQMRRYLKAINHNGGGVSTEDHLKILNDQESAFKKEIDAKERRIQNQNKQLQQLRSLLRSNNQPSPQVITSRVKPVHEVLLQKKDSEIEGYQLEINALQEMLEATEKQLENKTEESAEQTKKLEESERNARQANNEAATAKTELKTQQDKVAGLEKEVDDLQEELKTKEEKLKATEFNVQQEKNEAEKIQGKLDKEKDKVANLEKAVSQLQHQAKSDAGNPHAQLLFIDQTVQKQNQELEAQRKNLENQVGMQRSLLMKQEEQAKKELKRANELQESLSSLEQQVSVYQEEIKKLKDEKQVLEKQKAEAEEENSDAQTKIADLEQKIANNEKELNKVRAAEDRLKKTKIQKEREIVSNKEKHRKEKYEIKKDHESKLKEINTQHKKTLEEKMKEISDKNQELTEAREKLKQQQNQHKKAAKDMRRKLQSSTASVNSPLVSTTSPAAADAPQALNLPVCTQSTDEQGENAATTSSSLVAAAKLPVSSSVIIEEKASTDNAPIDVATSTLAIPEPVVTYEDAGIQTDISTITPDGLQGFLDQIQSLDLTKKLLNPGISVGRAMVETTCAGVDAGGDITPSGDGQKVNGRNKKNNQRPKKAPGSPDGNNGRNEPAAGDAPVENIGPSSISGDLAKNIIEVLRYAVPVLFPASLILGGLTTVFQYNEKKQTKAELDDLKKQFENLSAVLSEVEKAKNKSLTNSCDIAIEKLRPVCHHLKRQGKVNLDVLLTLLVNLGIQFPDQLMFPSLRWHLWGIFGSQPVSLKELFDKTSLKNGNCTVAQRLHLQLQREEDLYQKPVDKQAEILLGLMELSKPSGQSGGTDPLLAYFSQKEHSHTPLLIGMIQLSWAISSKHNKLNEALHSCGIKKLGERTLSYLSDFSRPESIMRSANYSGANAYTLFELDKEVPFILEGTTYSFDPGQSHSMSHILICGQISSRQLKRLCYSAIGAEDSWRIKLILNLPKNIQSAVPRLIKTSDERLDLEYSGISDEEFSETLQFLMDWIETEHKDASLDDKKAVFYSALIYIGHYRDENLGLYFSLLNQLWSMMSKQNFWLSQPYTDYMIQMSQQKQEGNTKNLILTPFWRLNKNQWVLTLTPVLLNNPLKGIDSTFQPESIAHIRVLNRQFYDNYYYTWSPALSKWRAVSVSGERLKVGSSLRVVCNTAFAVGLSVNNLDLHFAIDKDCKVINTFYGEKTFTMSKTTQKLL